MSDGTTTHVPAIPGAGGGAVASGHEAENAALALVRERAAEFYAATAAVTAARIARELACARAWEAGASMVRIAAAATDLTRDEPAPLSRRMAQRLVDDGLTTIITNEQEQS